MIIAILKIIRDAVDIVIRIPIVLGKIPLRSAFGQHFGKWISIQRVGEPGHPPDED